MICPAQPLKYGAAVTSDRVVIEPAFGSSQPIWLGRTAAINAQFPKNSACGKLGMMTGASCGIDQDSVRINAFGELVEHVSGCLAAFEATDLVRATPDELEATGSATIIRPSSLQSFAHWQPLPAHIERRPDKYVHTFCPAMRLTTGDPMLVPAQAAFLLWKPEELEPFFATPCATGIAAGTRSESALYRALTEVIERDACMLSWRVPGYPVVRLETDKVPSLLRETCAALELKIELYCVEHDGLPPTVIAVLSDRDDRRLTCSSACGPLSEALVAKAVCKALMFQWSMRNSSGAFVTISATPRNSLQHVARTYRDGARVAEWYRQQSAGRSSDNNRFADQRPSPVAGDPLALAEIAENAFDSPVVVVDLTDSIARESGWHVFRVVIPGALPREADGRIPHYGGFRLGRTLCRYELDPRSLHTEPHPFG